MQPSTQCTSLVKGYETCRLLAYLPTPQDVPTIGWGATGPDIVLGLAWTQQQADDRFARDLSRFSAGVRLILNGAPCSQGQFDALVSLAYNIGLSRLRTSTLLRKHIARDYPGAAAEFPKWNKQKGKVLRGLTRRRADEQALYLA